MTDNELKRIREKISCPQFGDDHYGEWGALNINQRRAIKRMLDHIDIEKAGNEHLQDLLVKNNNEIAKQEAEIERMNRIAIVPPCNIDDPVFFLGKYTGQIVKAYVTGIQKTQHDMFIFVDSGCFFSVNQQLGKSAFLTEEEAEKALEKENQK